MKPLSLLAALIAAVILIGVVSLFVSPESAGDQENCPLATAEFQAEAEAIFHADMLFSEPRSACWKKTRDEYLTVHPKCEFKGCKVMEKLQVHHVEEPFHVNPGRECDPTNLEATCWFHHIWVLHCGNTRDFNPNGREDFKRGRWPKEGLMRFQEHEQRKRQQQQPKLVVAL
jgi:hypothetical protein